MKAGFALSVGLLVASGCTTVQVARLDHCTVQKTTSWTGASKEEIVFCDREQPKWSDDRALRLTQECLYEADLSRRDALILSARQGHSPTTAPVSDDAFSRCYPDTVKSVQAENEALKEQLKRNEEEQAKLDSQRNQFESKIDGQRQQFQTALDSQRQKLEAQLDTQREKLQTQLDTQRERMESEHGKLEAQLVGQHTRLEDQLIGQHTQLDKALASQNGKLEDSLGKALSRPVNAVAEARSTSDSGSNVKHNSDSKELAHFDYGSTTPQIQNVRSVEPAGPVAQPRKLRPHPKSMAPTKAPACDKTCPTQHQVTQASENSTDSTQATTTPAAAPNYSPR